MTKNGIPAFWNDAKVYTSDVIGAKQNSCIKICYFFLLGPTGAALLLNLMTFCFLRRVYVLLVIQMMIINIATGIY
jgi:hypothetical protein